MAWPVCAGSGARRAPPSTAIVLLAARTAAASGPGWADAGCRRWSRRSAPSWRASPFHGEGHRKVWARLRVAGVRTSKRRVLRLMRENDLLAPSRVGAPRGPRNHDGTIIPETVDTMWGTDLTTTITGEGQVAVFVAVDHYSAECVGIHAARRATRFEALEPIRQGVRRCFGGFAQGIARGLPSGTITGASTCPTPSRRSLPSSGIESSPAFVRAPEGNGCAERFIRTLKENLLWVRTFDTVEELRQALLGFPGDLQHHLAHRTARVPDTRSRAAEPAFTRGTGRVGFNPVSHKPRAVHLGQGDGYCSGLLIRRPNEAFCLQLVKLTVPIVPAG